MNKSIRILVLFFLLILSTAASAQTDQPDNQVYEFIQVQDKPVIQVDTKPVFPQSAIDEGIDGTVVVTVIIDKNGNVTDAQIFRSVSGLDAAALTAAREKKFTPGKINGLPVITKMNIPIVFSLGDVQTGTATGGRRQPAAPSGEVVDLSGAAVRIKAEPDRPRVNIISDRIKPKFDNINLDKSFLPELKGEGEHIVIRKLEPEEQFETIEVKNLLNKSR